MIDEKGNQAANPKTDVIRISPPHEEMTPTLLLLHYGHGVFPWHNAHHGGQIWWSPNPRCVLYPHELRVNRTLRKVLKRNQFEVRVDTQFEEVMRLCAQTREQTWITSDLNENFLKLHELGHAHSFETYFDGELVGGLYGVAVGRLFCGESMFSTMNNASKIAFCTMAGSLGPHGFLIDCQLQTPHVKPMGARLIPKPRFNQEVYFRTRQKRLRDWKNLVAGSTPLQVVDALSSLVPPMVVGIGTQLIRKTP